MWSSCWRFSATSGSLDFNAASCLCNLNNDGTLAAGFFSSNFAMTSFTPLPISAPPGMRPSAPCAPLSSSPDAFVSDGSGFGWMSHCVYAEDSGPDFASTEREGFAQKMVVQFRANDPVFYDPTQQVVTFGVGGGAGAFRDAP